MRKETVITFIYSIRLNGILLTGCSSSGHRKLQNKMKYYYTFLTHAVIIFVSIFHMRDSQPFSANIFHNYQKFVTLNTYTWFVQKVSGLTTVHEVDKVYGVLTLIVFNIVPLRSYTLRPTFMPLLETFCELLFRDV